MSKSNPLERAFQIIDIVASVGRPIPLVEIVQRSGLPQSSVFRLASNLIESGMLSFSEQTKTYAPGSRALRLSLILTGKTRLEDLVRPVLQAISDATEETSFFVLRATEGNRLLRYHIPEIGARSFIHPGFSFPTHATAAGKVIGAFTASNAAMGAGNGELEAFQPATVTDPAKVAAMLQAVREKGYAVNDSELDKDVFSVCAPVFFGSELAGAVGFVGPRDRLVSEAADELDQMIASLVDEAAKLSQLLI